MSKYAKPPLTHEQQLDLLLKRGLEIPDRAKALHYLGNISYYRLSAYMLPHQVHGQAHQFKTGASFDHVLELYVFDRALRILVFDAIERIEIALRTRMIHEMAMRYGGHWHERPELFKNQRVFFELQTQIDQHCAGRNKEVFVQHYLDKYTEPPKPPSWMSLEIITMGSLSKVFQALAHHDDQKRIAAHFGLYPEVLQSWSHSITFVRNLCAHHSRFWNRELGIQPVLLQKPKHPWIERSFTNNRRSYYMLCCLRYMLYSINPKGSFTHRLHELLKKHPGVPIKYMGFTPDWAAQPLWANSTLP
jgi:abortive infection bacteriophage resistance protein